MPPPPLPDEAQLELLDPAVRASLMSLGVGLGEQVGRHLAAAGLLIDVDLPAALAHAQAARALAPRLPETREAVGVVAYTAGEFTLARSELRAAHRMAGTTELLPLLVDCERALGQPERALALAAQAVSDRLGREERIELAIVVSGARRDLGQPAAALRALSIPELDSERLDEPLLRLWYAYAEALLAAGRDTEAVQWFAAVAAGDAKGVTDAAERLAAATAPGQLLS